MRLARPILEGRIGVRVARLLERVLQHVHRVVEEVGIAIADGDVELAFELRAESSPIAREDRVEVVVIVPVRHHLLVDRARQRIDDLRRIAIGTSGRVDRLPDIPLLA